MDPLQRHDNFKLVCNKRAGTIKGAERKKNTSNFTRLERAIEMEMNCSDMRCSRRSPQFPRVHEFLCPDNCSHLASGAHPKLCGETHFSVAKYIGCLSRITRDTVNTGWLACGDRLRRDQLLFTRCSFVVLINGSPDQPDGQLDPLEEDSDTIPPP